MSISVVSGNHTWFLTSKFINFVPDVRSPQTRHEHNLVVCQFAI